MAVQKNVIKGILAGTFALMLSGCVTVPDAIKGAVHAATRFSSGDECAAAVRWSGARFGGKVVAVQNQQGKTRLELPPYRWKRSQTDAGRTFSRSHLCRCKWLPHPVDFRGQLVTVVGPITGAVDGKIGNTPINSW
ncbi:Slp family lipoprotein [Escherichia coli]